VCMTAATKPGHSVCADLVAVFSEEELSDAGGRDDCVSGRAAVDRGAGKTAAGVVCAGTVPSPGELPATQLLDWTV
jgi:hypothetical protein